MAHHGRVQIDGIVIARARCVLCGDAGEWAFGVGNGRVLKESLPRPVPFEIIEVLDLCSSMRLVVVGVCVCVCETFGQVKIVGQ